MDNFDRHSLGAYLQDAFFVEVLCSILADSIEQCKQDIHRSGGKTLKMRLQRLKQRLSAACTLRDQVYTVDVLPVRCRNIYAVYYLYGRFCSGQEVNLEEAIQIMNLDETRRPLDQMLLRDGKTLLNHRVRMAFQERDCSHMPAARRLVTDFLLAADYLHEK